MLTSRGLYDLAEPLLYRNIVLCSDPHQDNQATRTHAFADTIANHPRVAPQVQSLRTLGTPTIRGCLKSLVNLQRLALYGTMGAGEVEEPSLVSWEPAFVSLRLTHLIWFRMHVYDCDIPGFVRVLEAQTSLIHLYLSSSHISHYLLMHPLSHDALPRLTSLITFPDAAASILPGRNVETLELLPSWRVGYSPYLPNPYFHTVTMLSFNVSNVLALAHFPQTKYLQVKTYRGDAPEESIATTLSRLLPYAMNNIEYLSCVLDNGTQKTALYHRLEGVAALKHLPKLRTIDFVVFDPIDRRPTFFRHTLDEVSSGHEFELDFTLPDYMDRRLTKILVFGKKTIHSMLSLTFYSTLMNVSDTNIWLLI
ncbi:hypothetical protein ONZ45_g3907 [Pleurotus djamor]|nr:hypothetical protein ONZ45_g3907 [Pleurotus djamor]